MTLQVLFIFSLLIGICYQSDGQNKASTVVDPKKRTKVIVKPGLQIFIDYGKIITLPTDFETKAEAGIAYQMKNKLVWVIQGGYTDVKPVGAFENGSYEAKGMYVRLGMNYLLPLDITNRFYIGGRYGTSQFEESGSYQIGNTLWPNIKETYSRNNLAADWFEVILGSEQKSRNDHWLIGGTFALRILNKRDKFEPIDVFAIPGYGRAFDQTEPAVNVYIKYQF